MQDRLLGCVKKSRGHRGQPPSPCAWNIISYPHTQKRLLPLSAEGLETQMIHGALQRAIWAPSPFPSYFKSLLSSLHWFFFKLSAYSLFALELYVSSFNRFFLLPPSAFTKLTHAPWLYKAIYLVSVACAMGLFGGKKPDTVLSVTIATAAIQYSSEVPEQVEIKSWWLRSDVFAILIQSPNRQTRPRLSQARDTSKSKTQHQGYGFCLPALGSASAGLKYLPVLSRAGQSNCDILWQASSPPSNDISLSLKPSPSSFLHHTHGTFLGNAMKNNGR